MGLRQAPHAHLVKGPGKVGQGCGNIVQRLLHNGIDHGLNDGRLQVVSLVRRAGHAGQQVIHSTAAATFEHQGQRTMSIARRGNDILILGLLCSRQPCVMAECHHPMRDRE
jgi:hypothetical protein